MKTAYPTTRSLSETAQRLFLFAEWFFLLAGVLLCLPTKHFYPGLYLALLLLAVSGIARWVRIRRFTRPTPMDIPLLLCLLSLMISYFAAPNPEVAFTRLTLFLAAFSLFYALVNTPSRSIDLVLILLILLLAFTSLFLTSQYDWSLEPSRFSLHKSIGVQLNRLIPHLKVHLQPWETIRNILAALLGLFLSLLILQLYRTFNQVRTSPKSTRGWLLSRIKFVFLVLLALLVLLDLLLTESRAPWIVYSFLLLLTLWWWLSRRLGEKIKSSHLLIFVAGIALSILLLIIFVAFLPRDSRLNSMLPGLETDPGRLEIYPQSVYLAGDTPYTGGGLGAYNAFYSFYIRGIPFDAFFTEDTGNSLYLYILVEQGWLGMLSLILLLVLPLYIGLLHVDRSEIVDKGLVVAGIYGVGFVIQVGLVHSLLGASRAIPFLLLPAGLIFAGLGPIKRGFIPGISATHFRFNRRLIIALTIPILLLLSYLLLASAPRSAWYANLGAIRMARLQLAGWPTEAWEDGSSLPALAPAEALFQRSLALNPYNRTANHRLGLIALLRQDFAAAARFLESAYEVNPRYRGVIKFLGYTLLWKGETERAIDLLSMIPEAAEELESYVYWWQGFDRLDLSGRAAEAMIRLRASP